MAKIGDLEVDTINIAHGAVIGTDTDTIPGASPVSGGTASSVNVSAPNPIPAPTEVWASSGFVWSHDSGGDGTTFTLRAVRTRDNKIVGQRQASRSGISSGSLSLQFAVADQSAQVSETYSLQAITSSGSTDPSGSPPSGPDGGSGGVSWAKK